MYNTTTEYGTITSIYLENGIQIDAQFVKLSTCHSVIISTCYTNNLNVEIDLITNSSRQSYKNEGFCENFVHGFSLHGSDVGTTMTLIVKVNNVEKYHGSIV